MYSRPAKTIKHLLKSNKVLSIAIMIMVAAISMQVAAYETVTIMQECISRPTVIDGWTYNAWPPGGGKFVPGSSFSATCDYKTDIGQDLIF